MNRSAAHRASVSAYPARESVATTSTSKIASTTIESMPWILQPISQALPTTWMIDAARGVILRGAGWKELWPNAAILSVMAVVLITLAALKFKKRVS